MRKYHWAYYFLGLLILVAVFADFLANDRPIIAQRGGEVEFPVFSGNDNFAWKSAEYAWAVWPPIPFRAGATDLANSNYRPPFAQPRGNGGRHLLGTDQLGRDTLAGLVSGTRVAVIVGIGCLLISLLIGILLGSVAGYFGNDGLWVRRYTFWGVGVGLIGGMIYGFATRIPWYMTVVVTVVFVLIGYLLLKLISRRGKWLCKLVTVPVDRLVLQLIELFNSLPGLVLLIAILSIVSRPSIFIVVGVIGVLGWTTVARFLRAELLRIRSLPYIEAARVSRLGNFRILFRHALPNALGPVLVVAAFAVGLSILAESMLSFLGVGVPSDQVTWGSMLRQSRSQPAAWWLAIFPGLLLTVTVLACNSLGREGRAGTQVR